MQITSRSTATMPLASPEAFRLRIKKPSPMAAKTKRHELEATEAFTLSCTPSKLKPANVPATMSAKAAAISIEKSHTKIKKSRLPALPT